jgi:hypothetical protein
MSAAAGSPQFGLWPIQEVHMFDGEARIRIGMVGGGPGAGIGETHRIAMRMDNRYDLQAGELGYPTLRDGVIGLRFVDAVAESHTAGAQWTDSTITLPGE